MQVYYLCPVTHAHYIVINWWNFKTSAASVYINMNIDNNSKVESSYANRDAIGGFFLISFASAMSSKFCIDF